MLVHGQARRRTIESAGPHSLAFGECNFPAHGPGKSMISYPINDCRPDESLPTQHGQSREGGSPESLASDSLVASRPIVKVSSLADIALHKGAPHALCLTAPHTLSERSWVSRFLKVRQLHILHEPIKKTPNQHHTKDPESNQVSTPTTQRHRVPCLRFSFQTKCPQNQVILKKHGCRTQSP